MMDPFHADAGPKTLLLPNITLFRWGWTGRPLLQRKSTTLDFGIEGVKKLIDACINTLCQ